MRTKEFLIDLAERAVSTAAQSAIATIGVNQISALDLNWASIGGIALTAAILSALKSIVASKTGDPENAGLFQ